MTPTKHFIIAERDVLFTFPGLAEGERESAHVKLEIHYSYLPGSPGCRTQRNGDPGWPPDPAELELVSAKLIDGDGLAPTQQQINEWAIDWLDDAGYDEACDHAEQAIEADYCNARSREREDIFGND